MPQLPTLARVRRASKRLAEVAADPMLFTRAQLDNRANLSGALVPADVITRQWPLLTSLDLSYTLYVNSVLFVFFFSL